MSGTSEKCFELPPARRLENALLANGPNSVSLVNAGTFSNVDDVEALVELESQSDVI